MKKIEKKKPGPKPTGKGEPIMVRVLPELLVGLDAWASKQTDAPSRPEAFRRIAAEFLKRKGLL